MKIRVELDPQVVDFVRALAPEPRKRLREALHGLEHEKGDLQQLEADLTGYARLRVGGYRVIVRFFRKAANVSPAASSQKSAPWFTSCLPKFCTVRPAGNDRSRHGNFRHIVNRPRRRVTFREEVQPRGVGRTNPHGTAFRRGLLPGVGQTEHVAWYRGAGAFGFTRQVVTCCALCSAKWPAYLRCFLFR